MTDSLASSPGGDVAEGHYDIGVERWACSVSNQHRKAYGDRKIRQRTVMRLEGSVTTATGPQPPGVRQRRTAANSSY